MKNNKYEWFALAVAFCVFLSVLFNCIGCNVVNKHRSVVKENLDSSAVSKKDSGHVISKDSTATNLAIKSDSTGEHHKKQKQILVNFDTNNDTTRGLIFYDYDIGGTVIKSPQKIKSAVINDNSEDDSSATHKELKKDSLQVKLLDSNNHSSYDSTKEKKDTKTVDKTKESKRTSPWFIGGIILLIIIGGYFGGRKLGFFR